MKLSLYELASSTSSIQALQCAGIPTTRSLRSLPSVPRPRPFPLPRPRPVERSRLRGLRSGASAFFIFLFSLLFSVFLVWSVFCIVSFLHIPGFLCASCWFFLSMCVSSCFVFLCYFTSFDSIHCVCVCFVLIFCRFPFLFTQDVSWFHDCSSSWPFRPIIYIEGSNKSPSICCVQKRNLYELIHSQESTIAIKRTSKPSMRSLPLPPPPPPRPLPRNISCKVAIQPRSTGKCRPTKGYQEIGFWIVASYLHRSPEMSSQPRRWVILTPKNKQRNCEEYPFPVKTKKTAHLRFSPTTFTFVSSSGSTSFTKDSSRGGW